MTATFTCLTCGTVHYSADSYIACRASHPPPSLVDRLRFGSIDDDLLDAAKEAADEIERLQAALKLAEPAPCGYDETTGNCTQNPCCRNANAQPYINCWAVREVYFDEDGNPSMHRDPPQPHTPLTDMEIDDIWIKRVCIDAISAGDLMAQIRCAVRDAERFHGIGEAQ